MPAGQTEVVILLRLTLRSVMLTSLRQRSQGNIKQKVTFLTSSLLLTTFTLSTSRTLCKKALSVLFIARPLCRSLFGSLVYVCVYARVTPFVDYSEE